MDDSKKGWVKIHRQISDCWIWHDNEPFDKRSAWIDLLLLANRKDHKTPYKGELVLCKRGDVDRSVLWLSKRWNRSRWWVHSFLNLLEKDGMIQVNATTHRTTITIVNWAKYQDKTTTDYTADQTTDYTTNHTASRTHTRIDKNGKKREEVCVYTPTPNPSLEEIKAYCLERGFTHVNAEKFWNYYDSKNWMEGGQIIKWKQRLAYWEAKDIASGERKPGKKKAALDEEFWNELREKARKEDEERAKRERDAAG